MPDREKERSGELEEVLGRMPSWPIRWGSILILFLMLALLGYAWNVRYPQEVTAKAELIQKDPAIELASPRPGRIGAIWKKDGEKVLKGEAILFIGPKKELIAVERAREKALRSMKALRNRKLPPSLPPMDRHIDGAYNAYFRVRESLSAYRRSLDSSLQEKRLEHMRERSAHLKELLRANRAQENMAGASLRRTRSEHKVQKELLEKGAVSQKAFRKMEKRLLQEKRELKTIRERTLRTRINLSEIRQEKERVSMEHKRGMERKQKELKRALEAFLSSSMTWKAERTLFAPKKGRISTLRSLEIGDRVESGKKLLALIPKSEGHFARIRSGKKRMAEIEKGTEVRLKLHAYPSERFGVLQGKVVECSDLLIDGKYKFRVRLTNGLTTSYGKRIDPRAKATGEAELIAHERRLLERILFP